MVGKLANYLSEAGHDAGGPGVQYSPSNFLDRNETLRETLKKAAAGYLISKTVNTVMDLPSRLAERYKRENSITIDLGGEDIMEALSFFLAREVGHQSHSHYKVIQKFRGRSSSPRRSQNAAKAYEGEVSEGGKIALVPEPGDESYGFEYKGNYFEIINEDKEIDSLDDLKKRGLSESKYKLRAWSCGLDAVRELLKDAIEFYSDAMEGTVAIHVRTQFNGWHKMARKEPRSLEHIVTRRVIDPSDGETKKLKTELLEKMKRFLGEKYRKECWELGIPYQLGILLHGPPGTGKSSLAEALAGELDLDLYQMSLSNSFMDDQRLAQAFRETNAPSIILIEDVDKAFTDRKKGSENRGDDNSSEVSYSGFLQQLQGVCAQEGRIIMMTTNYLDRLDDAMIRHGRVDINRHVSYATKDQARRLFLKFYPPEEDEENLSRARHFASLIPSRIVSPAALQGKLRSHAESPGSILELFESESIEKIFNKEDRKTENDFYSSAMDTLESPEGELSSDKDTIVVGIRGSARI